jgi:hypothetical protein
MSNEYLANRYGKSPAKTRNQRVFWVSVGAGLLVTFFVWSFAVNFAAPAKLSANVQSFSVIDKFQTRVTIKVANPTGRDGYCAVNVLDSGFGVVGYKTMTVAGGLGSAPTIDAAINTTNLGVSATVDRCWLK